MKKRSLIIIVIIIAAFVGLLLAAVGVRFYTYAPAHYDEIQHPTPNVTAGRNRVQGVVLHHTALARRVVREG